MKNIKETIIPWLEKRAVLVLLLLTIVLATVNAVFGAPIGTGPISVVGSENGTENQTADSLIAQSGNLTGMNMDSETITDYWAGFYGDITETISLENAAGNVFYNWSQASPSGEVYAARASSVTWAAVNCSSVVRAEAEDTTLSIDSSATDSVNRTFYKGGNHSAFAIGGGTSFTADMCEYRTNAYTDAGSQTTNFDQILLNDSSTTVYATLIENEQAGFDSGNYDFELFVPSTIAGQIYYFFVELGS